MAGEKLNAKNLLINAATSYFGAGGTVGARLFIGLFFHLAPALTPFMDGFGEMIRRASHV